MKRFFFRKETEAVEEKITGIQIGKVTAQNCLKNDLAFLQRVEVGFLEKVMEISFFENDFGVGSGGSAQVAEEIEEEGTD